MPDEPTLANILAGDDPYGYGNPNQVGTNAYNMLSWPLPPKDAGWMRQAPPADAGWLRRHLTPLNPTLADFLTQALQYGPMALSASKAAPAKTLAGDVPPPLQREMSPHGFVLERSPHQGAENWFVRPPGGRGGLEGRVEDGGLQILGARLPEGERGQGYGVAMYQRLIDDAHAAGYPVRSDASVSPSARRIYESLARRGYEVSRNPRAVEKDGGLHDADYSAPVFTILPPRK